MMWLNFYCLGKHNQRYDQSDLAAVYFFPTFFVIDLSNFSQNSSRGI